MGGGRGTAARSGNGRLGLGVSEADKGRVWNVADRRSPAARQSPKWQGGGICGSDCDRERAQVHGRGRRARVLERAVGRACAVVLFSEAPFYFFFFFRRFGRPMSLPLDRATIGRYSDGRGVQLGIGCGDKRRDGRDGGE